jgi:hypothetical protein
MSKPQHQMELCAEFHAPFNTNGRSLCPHVIEHLRRSGSRIVLGMNQTPSRLDGAFVEPQASGLEALRKDALSA